MKKIEIDYFGKKLSIETGRMARQANGSVLVTYGETMVLVTAVGNKKPMEGATFFPLQCVYQFKKYSLGKIPGGFGKRENRPTDSETLVSRLIDRPIRPLFDEGYNNETQIIATVISYDEDSCPKAAAMLGASAALYISDIPFNNPIAGVTVGRIDGKLIVNPSEKELLETELNLFMSASKDAITMVESEAKQVSEEVMLEALTFGQESIKALIDIQEELRTAVGKEKFPVIAPVVNDKLTKAVNKDFKKKLEKALTEPDKLKRYDALDLVKDEAKEKLQSDEEGFDSKAVSNAISALKGQLMRTAIIKEQKRVDGRKLDEVRPIDIDLDILKRAHGSALFTRGETQALVALTMGAKEDELAEEFAKGLVNRKFFLHYNFPSFSVGEIGRMGAPGRREVGHGRLAERGLSAVLPDYEKFPYTIRLVSEILESNGSSSMASVCGGTLAMMSAGVPLEAPVAGIAMGLIAEGEDNAILTDILGDEDHIGDMDFKVVGTEKGITALQMDIKINGLSKETLKDALEAARKGRLHILDKMNAVISSSSTEISPRAPRFIQYKIPTSKIRDIIGPGGKNIKAITAETNVRMDINDSGVINISSANKEDAESAVALIRDLIKEVEIGSIYDGRVKKIMDFGAFVEILPGTEGLVHVSEVSGERIENLDSVLSEGQKITVKALGYDKRGKLKLSMKALTQEEIEAQQAKS